MDTKLHVNNTAGEIQWQIKMAYQERCKVFRPVLWKALGATLQKDKRDRNVRAYL